MTGNNDPVHKQASQEATDWLILLHDDPEDVELRRAFEAWLKKSPANAAAWEAMQQASKAMDKATPVHAGRWKPALAELRGKTENDGAGAAAPLNTVRTRHSSPLHGRHMVRSSRKSPVGAASSRDRRSIAGRIAAGSRSYGGCFKAMRLFEIAASRINRRQAIRFGGVAALACLLALFIAPGLLLDLHADYTTGTAETRTIRLSDDSTVTLAPESAITVTYTPDERHIRLLAGAAFFEVTPNAERPFEVAAKTLDITVIGTGFDVRSDDDGADVTVAHGAVRVGHASAVPPVAETLTAGQSIRVSWAGRAERRAVPVDQIAAWRHGELIARDEPLGAVVEQLRPYYAGRIVVTDEALAARPVTGVYNLNDPVAALRAIARAQNAAVRRVTPWLIIVSTS